MDLIGYVTFQEAEDYIRSHYVCENELRRQWELTTVDDKVVLLNRSFQVLEMLPFAGRKLDPKQPNAFPRWPQKEVPVAIKWAQIENALAKSDTSNEEDAKFYERLWMYGVESYSIGNLSERTSTGSYSVGGARATGVTSAIADRLLRPYLGGGYRM